MRPAWQAARPASTASLIATAISSGSAARVIAEATSTPAQPSSIARAASLAVPIPASRITGTPARSTIIAMLCGFLMPSPEPIGAPSGITAAHPASSRRSASTGSSFVYGSTVNPSATSSCAASSSSTGSGSSVMSSATTSSLTQSVPERLAGQPGDEQGFGGGVAAGRVREDGDTSLPDGAEQGALPRRVDPAHRHRGELRS